MISQGLPDMNMRPEMSQAIDMQQLMMSMDQSASNPLRNLYLSQLGLSNGGSPSPTSLPSSGPASASGAVGDAGQLSPKASTPSATSSVAGTTTATSVSSAGEMPAWFKLLPQQFAQQPQQPQPTPSMAAIMEQMQAMQNGLGGLLGAGAAGGNALSAVFANNPNAALSAAALMQQATVGSNPTTPNKIRPKREDVSPMKLAASPQLAAQMMAFPFLTPSTSTASQPSVIVNGNNTDSDEPSEKRCKIDDDEDEEKPKNALDSLLMAAMNQAGTACDECGAEFTNTFAMLTHKAQTHMKDVKEPSSPIAKCRECDKEFESMAFLEQHQLTHHNPLSQRPGSLGNINPNMLLSGLLPPGFPPLPFMLPPGMQQQFPMSEMDLASMGGAVKPPAAVAGVKRQYSSNGKNYCDLCNKEVCNKYFLRTHMLKMHGIVIDENKTVIANIDTLEKEKQGTLTFRCDICNMELKSRQMLRSHKQDTHGVMPISTPARTKSIPTTPTMPGSTPDEKCPLCEKRVPLHLLTVHMGEHAGASFDLMQQFGKLPISPQKNAFECKMCHSSFDSDVALQMHHITDHTRAMLGMVNAGKEDASLLRCKQCQYVTREPRNLEMHMERHERMHEAKATPEEEDEALQVTTHAALQMVVNNQMDVDRYKCGLCDISYTDANSLAAHTAVAHTQAALNLTMPKVHLKKEIDEVHEKANERNSHTSGSISPLAESLPEGFGSKADGVGCYPTQSFVLRLVNSDVQFPSEMLVHLPVKMRISAPTTVTFEILPQPTTTVSGAANEENTAPSHAAAAANAAERL